jgi:hypothetical protein
MYVGLLHLHSNLPYLLLLLMLLVLVFCLKGMFKSEVFGKTINKLVLFAMITAHIQWTVGLVLYFVSPNVKSIGQAMSNSTDRLYALEHPLLMTIALVLLTIARVKSKKSEDTSMYKKTAIYFMLALACILFCLPPNWL